MKKVIVWVCAVVCVLMACVVPCWADTWDEVAPNYGLPFVGAPTYANGTNNTEMVIEAVEKATKLGMFGGAQPVLIVYMFDENNDSTRILVIVPSANMFGSYNVSNTGAFKSVAYKNGNSGFVLNNNVQTVEGAVRTPFVTYCLQYSGDWAITRFYNPDDYLQTDATELGQQTTTIYKRVAMWSTSTRTWEQPTPFGFDIIGWGANTTEFAYLRGIVNKYDEQIDLLTSEAVVVPPATYELDIATIFDGMFNGVHNIFEGFDIELFGISIVGVLVACLVIAIVTFIVKRLWK